MISNFPPPAALTAIQSGVARVTRRAEICEADGEAIWTPSNGEIRSRLITGSISLDYARAERRAFDMELDNSDSMLDLGNSTGFWYNKIIKPYRGVRYPITPVAPHFQPYDTWETQVGEFMIDKITDSYNDSRVKVSGRDYTKKCLTSKLEHSMSFNSGTYVYEIVRSLAANAGIVKMKIPFTNETIGSAFDLERGTERWTVMTKAANSANYDLYFDNEGYLVMEKYSDPALSASIATFKTGEDGNLVTFDKSSDDSRLYNHIIVTGDRESVEGGAVLMPYFGEAKNEDENSPTRIGKIGDRAFFYSSSFFTADSQCEELAKSWLSIHSLETYEINWSSICYPWLDVGKVVDMYEPRAVNATKYLLDTLTIPMSLDAMSATGKRILKVG